MTVIVNRVNIFVLQSYTTRIINKVHMAKENLAKENPVVDALRKLKEEEAELLTKLKPLQEAINALEKIVPYPVFLSFLLTGAEPL